MVLVYDGIFLVVLDTSVDIVHRERPWHISKSGLRFECRRRDCYYR